LSDLSEKSVHDFHYYDCGDRKSENHKVKNIREHIEKLYQKPSGEILLAVFRNIEILTDESAHALLRLFEDIPSQVLILVTSQAPQKIIPTLLSRTILIDGGVALR
jgi:DNA polymerase III gamma/tau subunit